MKNYISLMLIVVLSLSLYSCKQEMAEEVAKVDSIVENVQEETQNSEIVLSEAKNQTIEYEIDDLLKMSISNNTAIDLREFPSTFEEFLKRLEESNCSIVAGRAFGTRSANPSVVTKFSVEKNYAGPTVPTQINVQENFGVYSDQMNEPYLLSLGYDYFPILNDQPTLLFIYPHSQKKDLYLTDLIPIPLPEDHQNYDEEYLTELLDYFRGDRSAYKYPELTIKETVIEGRAILAEYGGVYWPTREISDEALLEEMNDHILLRLATDYKIKIWPFDHAQYPEERNLSDYFLKMSYPPDV